MQHISMEKELWKIPEQYREQYKMDMKNEILRQFIIQIKLGVSYMFHIEESFINNCSETYRVKLSWTII
jgi:hypothetical protein